MIDINLLPRELRKKRRQPTGWMLACAFFALALGAIAALIARCHFTVIPGIENNLIRLQKERGSLIEKRNELGRLRSRAEEVENYSRAVKKLYRSRTAWSKVLYEIKQSVSAEQDGAAPLWLTRVAGYGRLLSLDGFAAASSREEAGQLAEKLTDVVGKRGLLESPPRLKRIDPVELTFFRDASGKNAHDKKSTVAFTIELKLKDPSE